MIEKLIILGSDKERSMKYNARKRMKIYDHWGISILILKSQRSSVRHGSKIKHTQ